MGVTLVIAAAKPRWWVFCPDRAGDIPVKPSSLSMKSLAKPSGLGKPYASIRYVRRLS